MMGDDATIVSTSDTTTAMVHAEQSSRGALKYRGMFILLGVNFIS